MTIRQPPGFAGRLLKRLVPAQDHDALLGDLCEEYQRGRSIAWYWMQILAGIVVGSWRDARAHWVLALRASAVGLALFPAAGLLHLRDRLAYVQVVLIYGLSNRPHHWLSVLGPHTFVFSDLISAAGFVASGWVIVRLHRSHGIALVMPFTAVIAALALTDFLRPVLLMPAWTLRGVFILLLSAAASVAFLISILLGGSLATRSTEQA
jgi:hypothetical protein